MRHQWVAGFGLVIASLTAPAFAQTAAPIVTADVAEATNASATAGNRNGREIYERFRGGLADPDCDTDDSSPRWRQHFASAPKRLAARNDDLLPLFGYVVEALREAHLPTEYALIPFVESGYRPGARSPSGPAGLWQMIALTARDHGVPIRSGYDGRLSPIDSTRAAVRYLKTLHGMFAGDWRLAVMAYNAGEYRVLGALKRSGQAARNAEPAQLPGLSDITQAYVRKLHALSCLMEQADDREEWLRALDRPVPRLQAVALPADVQRIDQWATRNGQDAAQLLRFNPVFGDGRISKAGGEPARLLAAADIPDDTRVAATTVSQSVTMGDASSAGVSGDQARQHTVVRGENVSTIARRYGVSVADLLQRNGLRADSVLRPGKVLAIDSVAFTDSTRAKTGLP
ncbi:transglycosylase SLT domain-containing protein [Lysobacter cavernae]|uniref:Transglycosylase SLT domain-containing protein n=1 Tax=Lysobacter cavernae TaxID=1685901 RepID=A0ABV7RRE7_9GAMM